MTDERTVAGNPAPASADDERPTRPPRLSFRSRLTLALLFAAIVPLAVFGVVVLAFEIILGRQGADQTFAQILFFALAILLAFAIVAAFALATELLAPLRSVVAAVKIFQASDAPPASLPSGKTVAIKARAYC